MLTFDYPEGALLVKQSSTQTQSQCGDSEIRDIIRSSFRSTLAKAGVDRKSRNFKVIWIPAGASPETTRRAGRTVMRE
jgi:hypothetical protein